jgi:hypothetical protein
MDRVIKVQSVTITDYENRFLHAGPDGVMIQDVNGNGLMLSGGALVAFIAGGGDAKTLLQMTKSELSLL